jgi:hypothetical protein
MTTNKLEVKKMKSEYLEEGHLTILIDDVPLDVLLDRIYPNHRFLGLIPTNLDWLNDQKEKDLLQSRYHSIQKEILPILMCPDDCDLWCTVIVADVVKAKGYIIWDKIGIDMSTREDMLLGYDCIGTKVDWLDKLPKLIFVDTEHTFELNKIYC